MSKNRIFGNGPGFKPMAMAPAFGEPVYEIIIQVDRSGMMKTTITRYPIGNPPSQLQVMGMLLDCMNGQFQGMKQAVSMIIQPKEVLPNGGETKKGNDGNGGSTGEPNGS